LFVWCEEVVRLFFMVKGSLLDQANLLVTTDAPLVVVQQVWVGVEGSLIYLKLKNRQCDLVELKCLWP
jgi:hypothetical protein